MYARTSTLAAVLAHVLNVIPDVAIRHNVKFVRYKMFELLHRCRAHNKYWSNIAICDNYRKSIGSYKILQICNFPFRPYIVQAFTTCFYIYQIENKSIQVASQYIYAHFDTKYSNILFLQTGTMSLNQLCSFFFVSVYKIKVVWKQYSKLQERLEQ